MMANFQFLLLIAGLLSSPSPPLPPPLSSASLQEQTIPAPWLMPPYIPNATGPVIVVSVPFPGTTTIEIIIDVPGSPLVFVNTTVDQGQTSIPLFAPPLNEQLPNPLPPGTNIYAIVTPPVSPQPPISYAPIAAPPIESLEISVQAPAYPLPPSP